MTAFAYLRASNINPEEIDTNAYEHNGSPWVIIRFAGAELRFSDADGMVAATVLADKIAAAVHVAHTAAAGLPPAELCRHDRPEPLASMQGDEIAARHFDGRSHDELKHLLLFISGYCPDAVQSALNRHPAKTSTSGASEDLDAAAFARAEEHPYRHTYADAELGDAASTARLRSVTDE